MSNENKKINPRRPYTLKARARRQQDVRHRITLAAMHLHQKVGPAKTTMSAIAEHAGVQRATVYNHFASEFELYDACSTHWFRENPPPDAASWTEISDPVRKTEAVMLEIYEYFEHGREMLGNVLRDAVVVPAMEEIRRQKWVPFLESITDLLIKGWEPRYQGTGKPEERVVRLRATIRVALDFFTWQALVDSGLNSSEAAQTAVLWIISIGNDIS